MVLCFFSAQYLPTVGGVERYTYNLAKRAVAAGHRALVVTSALPGLPEEETDADGIEIYRLPSWPVMKGRFPVIKPGPAFRRVARRLWANPIDFCLVQTKMYTQSVWAAVAARRRGIPFLVVDHSTGYMPMGRGLAGLCARLYEQAACGIIKAQRPAFYGVSGDVCRWLRSGFGITAAGCLPNAVDPAELARIAETSARDWRAELKLAPDAHLVAYVGRLIPEKGAAALAQAVASLPDTVLVAAGDGPLLEELRARKDPRIFCPGSVAYPDVVALLCQADCYCLPTRYAEGFPTTLLEAAACRCPIVCTPTAGTSELLPGPDHAVLLTDTDPASLADALRGVLSDPEKSRAMAEATYNNLCGHFTWDAVFDKMMTVAQSMTAPSGGK